MAINEAHPQLDKRPSRDQVSHKNSDEDLPAEAVVRYGEVNSIAMGFQLCMPFATVHFAPVYNVTQTHEPFALPGVRTLRREINPVVPESGLHVIR